MKPFLLTLLLVIPLTPLFAQKVFPALADKPVWSIEWSDGLTSGVDIFYYGPDTVTNSLNPLLKFSGWNYYLLNNTIIRIDNKKVWAKYELEDYKKEHLLYDFSLEVGDSIFVGNPYSGNGYVDSMVAKVIDKDSILVETGYKKRLSVELYACVWSAEKDIIYWIEGIGSTGPFYLQKCGGHFNSKFSCYKEKEQLIYKKDNYTNCIWESSYVSINEEADEPHLNFYPNPVTDEMNITLNTATIEIFTTDGKCVFSDASYKSFAPINIAHLPAGIYILKIIGNGRTYFERIVKR